MSVTKDQLLAAGARNLREFGYPDARPDNVMTTYLFAQFFRPMLEEARERDDGLGPIVEPMLAEIDALKSPY